MLRSRVGEQSLELVVTGYQFPDAAEPAKRYSWHQVRGAAVSGGQRWSFAYPAFTCDETPRVSAWLRAVAWHAEQHRGADLTSPPRLEFTEPNIALEVIPARDGLVVRVLLSQEFRAPWLPNPWEESALDLTVTAHDLQRAASAWDHETATFPDGLA